MEYLCYRRTFPKGFCDKLFAYIGSVAVICVFRRTVKAYRGIKAMIGMVSHTKGGVAFIGYIRGVEVSEKVIGSCFLPLSSLLITGSKVISRSIVSPGAIFSKMSILLSRIPPVLSVCTVPFITADMPSDISYSFVSSAVTATGTVIFLPYKLSVFLH